MRRILSALLRKNEDRNYGTTFGAVFSRCTRGNGETMNGTISYAAAQYIPVHEPANLVDDDPFPLGRPTLYFRYNLDDDVTSQTGPLSSSPDLIVKDTAVANPQATYSTPGSISSDTESDPSVLGGQDNYVSLQVLNRGTDAVT